MENYSKSLQSIDSLPQKIKARAESLGFCLCGITGVEELEKYPIFERWLDGNHFGSMDYLNSGRHRDLRQHPLRLVPWARSILVLAWPYMLGDSTPTGQNGLIAGYAGSIDYHIALPRILQPLIDELPRLFGLPVRSQIYTDSAPILERELAVRAGLGWIGKNSCLINPQYGSSFLLAELFIDQELPAEEGTPIDRCGQCTRCIDACPSQCILPDRTIDAGLCLSALTIENKGAIPRQFHPAVSNRLFGCDRCQSVCPWNRSRGKIDPVSNSLDQAEMISLLSIDESQFRTRFKNTAFMRLKRHGLIRNLCTVLGNLRSLDAVPVLESILANDPDPMIRLYAAAALIQIDPVPSRELISGVIARETDAAFLEGIREWM
jgi:epoxyqueuosine reductase